MFQSLWNVAAAFCGHESTISSNQLVSTHFGHHVALHCRQDQQQHAIESSEYNHSLVQVESSIVVYFDSLAVFYICKSAYLWK